MTIERVGPGPGERFCRQEECTKRLTKKQRFYCPRHKRELREELKQTVDLVLESDPRSFYVGRSAHPERRLLQHYAKHKESLLAILHWSGDKAEADWLETTLIREFLEDSGCRNGDPDSTGSWSGEFNCVYVVWRPSRRLSWASDAKASKALGYVEDVFGEVEVDLVWDLDFGMRRFPVPWGDYYAPIILAAALSHPEAVEIDTELKRLYRERREQRKRRR